MEKKKNIDVLKLKEDTESARKLSELIPIENLKLYIGIYWGLKAAQQKLDNNRVKKSKSTLKDIIKQFIKVYKSLFNILGKDITNEASILILEKLWEKHYREIILGLWQQKYHKTDRPSNFPLDVLIYALAYDLKLYTGRPHYFLIADFLNEQGIDNDRVSYEILKKRIRDIDKNKLVDKLINLYLFAQEDYFSKAFDIAGVEGFYNGFYKKVHDTLKQSNEFLQINHLN